MKNLKNQSNLFKSTSLLALSLIMSCMFSCNKEETTPTPTSSGPVNKESNVTASSFGRTNKKLGCLDISGKSITIAVWDNETVDGDIVSVYVNNKRVINEVEMGGPSAKTSVTVDLDYAGFNDIKLYAHNLGQYRPNTAAMSIKDANGTKNFTIESDLETNGYFDLVVGGSGVTCGSSGSGGGSGTGSGGTGTGGTGTGGTGTGGTGSGGTGGSSTPASGQIMFWSSSDLGCGAITVVLKGISKSYNGYYDSGAPDCGDANTATYTLAPGTYSFTASCTNYSWPATSITITDGICNSMRLE